MSWEDNAMYTYMVGIAGILLTVIGWISIRRGAGLTQRQMENNAKICYIIGTLKICAGIFVLTSMAAGPLWGFMLILFGVLWVVRGNRWKRLSLLQRARNANGAAGNNANANANGDDDVAAPAGAPGNDANGNNNNGSNGSGYRRIPEEVDGPEGPVSNDPIIVQIQGNNNINKINNNNSMLSPEYYGMAANAAGGTNTFIPQSHFGVISPIPMNSAETTTNGAVPPAAFPGPSYGISQAGIPINPSIQNNLSSKSSKLTTNAPIAPGAPVMSVTYASNVSNGNNDGIDDGMHDNVQEKNNENDRNKDRNDKDKIVKKLLKSGKKKNKKNSNDELTVPLNKSENVEEEIPETAPIPYSIPVTHLNQYVGIDSNNSNSNSNSNSLNGMETMERDNDDNVNAGTIDNNDYNQENGVENAESVDKQVDVPPEGEV